jgi:hypothetical protein
MVATVAAGIVAGSLVARLAVRARSGARRAPRFDPVAVARIEATAWRAYYDRNFPRGLALLVQLSRSQLGLGPIDALRASHAAVRAQVAFAPMHNDPATALRWLERFYVLSPRRDGVRASDLARAELDYWVVHRRLVGAADKTPLVDALASLHALIFGGSEAAMRPSAELRALACAAVDRITSRTSTDPDGDWRRVEAHLTAAYRLALAASPDAADQGDGVYVAAGA